METVTSTSGSQGSMNNIREADLACKTCGVTFTRNEEQREHMRSEWHVYNLKRHIANLPSLSSENLKERVQGSQDQDQDTPFIHICTSCDKAFYNPKTWGNHVEKSRCAARLKGLVHEENLAALSLNDTEVNTDVEHVENEGGTCKPNTSTKCLFCTHFSDSLETNVSHMHKTHGLFIPDQEYIVDLESLLSYFYTVINEFCECLYCGKEKGNGEAVRMHMVDKGHCNINLDDTAELEGFYDFEGVWEREDGRYETQEFMDGEGKGKAKANQNDDAGVLIPEDDGSIRLPSGRILGHRSHVHDYRKNDHNYQGTLSERLAQRMLVLEEQKQSSPTSEGNVETSESSSESKSKAKVSLEVAISTLSNSRVRGVNSGQLTRRGTDQISLIGLSDVEKRAVVATEQKMMKIETRARNEMRRKMEKKGNQQKTFKPDVPGPKLG